MLDFLDEQIKALSAEITGYLTSFGLANPSAPPAGTTPPDGRMGQTADPDATAGTPMSFACAVTVLDTIPEIDQRRRSCSWPSGARTCGALARLAVCRPGPASPCGTMIAQRNGFWEKPAKATAPCGPG
jgi:hypothetical protein